MMLPSHFVRIKAKNYKSLTVSKSGNLLLNNKKVAPFWKTVNNLSRLNTFKVKTYGKRNLSFLS